MLHAFFMFLLILCDPPDGHITVDQIKQEYRNLFSIETMEVEGIEDRAFIQMTVNRLSDEHFLSVLVNTFPRYFDYLLHNAVDFESEGLTRFSRDEKSLENYFYETLSADPGFNRCVLPVIDRYLRKTGRRIIDLPECEQSRIDIVSLKKVAVRFFYPYRIDRGKVRKKICVGIHGLDDWEGERDHGIEAFCFTAVWNSRGSLMKVFDRVIDSALAFRLSHRDDVKLSRLQGAVWAFLSEEKEIERILIDAYGEMEDLLPFSLVF